MTSRHRLMAELPALWHVDDVVDKHFDSSSLDHWNSRTLYKELEEETSEDKRITDELVDLAFDEWLRELKED